jgi:orotidine-5'-phosphate decarboxylase
MNQKPHIFCALDTDDLDHACALAKAIGPVTGGLKLGLEFFNSFGPQGVETVRKACPESALFIDLKFHDIPNTVAGAVRSVSRRLKPDYLNVHAIGGLEMMRAAKDACEPATKLLAVTILTSMDDAGLARTGQLGPLTDQVKRLAALTQEAGLAGVVCSAHEIEALRALCDPDFVLMVPGIRPSGSDHQDQKRVMTPKQALQKGATHLVIGRPITGDTKPAKAAQAILDEIAA